MTVLLQDSIDLAKHTGEIDRDNGSPSGEIGRGKGWNLGIAKQTLAAKRDSV